MFTGVQRASMGPRTSIRGNVSMARYTSVQIAASMGPRTSIRGNHGSPRLALDDSLLQWGRGLPSAETCIDGEPAVGRVRASMGPRTSIRGNTPNISSSTSATTRFNGAADFHPRKRITIPVNKAIAQWLQWGRGLPSAETACLRSV